MNMNTHVKQLQAQCELILRKTIPLAEKKKNRKKKNGGSVADGRVQSAASRALAALAGTRAALPEVEITHFKSSAEVLGLNKPSKKEGLTPVSKAPSSEHEPPLFDLRKAKYEVLKFGIAGFEKQKREDAMVSLAIKLGAKPPKKENVRYPELKQKLHVEREEAKVEREALLKQGVRLAKRRSTVAQRRKKDQNKVAGFDPMGPAQHFKGGVQKVKVNFKKRK